MGEPNCQQNRPERRRTELKADLNADDERQHEHAELPYAAMPNAAEL